MISHEDVDADLYKPHYSVHAPRTTRASEESSHEVPSLTDIHSDLFEYTMSKFAPSEPNQDAKHRAVRRVRVFDHHNDHEENTNIPHVVRQLKECETFKGRHLNKNKEFHSELKASELRLQLVKRGVSFNKLITEDDTFREEQPCEYKVVEPTKRFEGVSEVIRKIPKKYSGVPPVRKIQFIYPVTARQTERVDLVARINLTDGPRARLKRIRQRSNDLHLMYHNEMIDHLNHTNERRSRAAQMFWDDMNKYGIERAQINAKRAASRSRLRYMCKAEWWQEFMSENVNGRISKFEEKFIERLARNPDITVSTLIKMIKEMERNPNSGRCRQWLDWINEHVGIIDKQTLAIMLDNSDLN